MKHQENAYILKNYNKIKQKEQFIFATARTGEYFYWFISDEFDTLRKAEDAYEEYLICDKNTGTVKLK